MVTNNPAKLFSDEVVQNLLLHSVEITDYIYQDQSPNSQWFVLQDRVFFHHHKTTGTISVGGDVSELNARLSRGTGTHCEPSAGNGFCYDLPAQVKALAVEFGTKSWVICND